MDIHSKRKKAAIIAVLAFLEEERNRKTKNTWVHSGRQMAMGNRQMAHTKFFK
ncbi:MAG: hypothetical protein OCD02_22520 [Spirochaetaceae bacterium]